ncbi:SHOCT domain-containing protein [Agromyces aureus]|uniref:SHOCT domain-containing protein n=1 Tax=Agromyces aureus TaxID=453304 RepID=UPI000AF1978A|nr:SHOCT domain-containing protein [Agromyces aureus]
MNLWDFFVWLFWFYVLIACIWVFITVIVDIFRDPTLNGWAKALWVVFLIFLPFLAAFIYLIARGRGMNERKLAEVQAARAQSDEYIRTVAGSSGGSSAASEIESGKRLLDSGTITQAEFDALKAKALQNG